MGVKFKINESAIRDKLTAATKSKVSTMTLKVNCPHCGKEVTVRSGQLCPSCSKKITFIAR